MGFEVQDRPPLQTLRAGEIGVTQLEEDCPLRRKAEATQHQRLGLGRLEVNRLTQIFQAPSR